MTYAYIDRVIVLDKVADFAKIIVDILGVYIIEVDEMNLETTIFDIM